MTTYDESLDAAVNAAQDAARASYANKPQIEDLAAQTAAAQAAAESASADASSAQASAAASAALVDAPSGAAIDAGAGNGLVIYVSAAGNNSSSGKQWGSAKATVKGALTALGASAGKIIVGPGTITETVAWGTINPYVTIEGSGRETTKILKGFSGDLATLSTGVHIREMTVDLQGATYTGYGLSILGTASVQRLTNLWLINGDGPCLYLERQAASGLNVYSCSMYRVSAGTTTDRFAVVVQDGGVATVGAVPRRFVSFSSEGACSFDFGSCDNFYITTSTLGDTNWTPRSRAVLITSSRLLNDMAVTVDGHNNAIVGCDVNPQITIASGADAVTIGPGSFNQLPVIDSSGNGRNNVTHWVTTFTPTLTTSGTAPSLGDGTLTGTFSRNGSIVRASYLFTVGASTTLGTGELRFGLPYTRGSGQIDVCGQGVITVGSTVYTVVAQSTGANGYVRLLRDSGIVSSTSPVAITSGSTIRFSISLQQ
jgi:hypothetical protein